MVIKVSASKVARSLVSDPGDLSDREAPEEQAFSAEASPQFSLGS